MKLLHRARSRLTTPKSEATISLASSLASWPDEGDDSSSGDGQVEVGLWHYFVVDAHGVRPRQDAGYDSKKINKGPRYLHEQVLRVDQRIKHGCTRWLSVKGQPGWLHDISPKKDLKVRLVEAEVAEGRWKYKTVCENAAIIPQVSPQLISRFACGATRPTCVLNLGEVVHVEERVRPLNGKGSFLKLADGRGWVVDFTEGKQMMREIEDHFSANPQCQAPEPLVSCTSPLTTHAEPEYGERSDMIVDPGDICIRGVPFYGKSEKLSRRIDEGQIVQYA